NVLRPLRVRARCACGPSGGPSLDLRFMTEKSLLVLLLVFAAVGGGRGLGGVERRAGGLDLALVEAGRDRLAAVDLVALHVQVHARLAERGGILLLGLELAGLL